MSLPPKAGSQDENVHEQNGTLPEAEMLAPPQALIQEVKGKISYVQKLGNFSPLGNNQTFLTDTHIGRILSWNIFDTQDIELLMRSERYAIKSRYFEQKKSRVNRWFKDMEEKFSYPLENRRWFLRKRDVPLFANNIEKDVNSFLEYVLLDYLWDIFQSQQAKEDTLMHPSRAYKTTPRDDRESRRDIIFEYTNPKNKQPAFYSIDVRAKNTHLPLQIKHIEVEQPDVKEFMESKGYFYIPNFNYGQFQQVDIFEFNCLFVYTLAKTYLAHIYNNETISPGKEIREDTQKLLNQKLDQQLYHFKTFRGDAKQMMDEIDASIKNRFQEQIFTKK